ncbi:MAG: hypothetical protein QHJ73_15870, partial [Armatimonadota bacterium]|nr:hypothetical protein [Armatimonadota bacterium]
VGSGEERILFRLTEGSLTAEVSPAYWQRIVQQVQRQLDDGTLLGAMLGAGTAHLLNRLKRWYLGPHDLAAVDVSYDGCSLRVQRHGVGDSFGRNPVARPNGWYAALDAVGGCWSEGFEAEEARAFVEQFRRLREARMQTLAYAARVGGRVLAATLVTAGVVAGIAWTIRNPRKPA